MKTSLRSPAWILVTGIACGSAPAQEAKPQAAAPAEKAQAEPEGLLPLVDYSGTLAERSRLTGDWGGTRKDLALRGLSFDADWTQIVQGVVSGGRQIDWDYGGSFDLSTNVDLHRMGVIPGGLLRTRVEARYGESINDDVGTVLPANTDALFPLTSPVNDGILTVTELNYTQFLAPWIAITLGKFQTLDGDLSEFASGRGRTQFMNLNFVLPSVSALTVPYSTLGGGIMLMPSKQIAVNSMLIATNDSSTTTGFDTLGDGWTWLTEASFQYRLGSLPGGFNAGFTYAFANDFAHITGKLSLVPGEGVTLPTKSDSWSAYASAWQYLYTPEEAPEVVDLRNGRPDIRGVGLFARVGFADHDTNPIDIAISGGLGGKGTFSSRPDDLWGFGYFYNKLEDGRRLAVLNLEDSTQGLEAFYNIAITPAVGLSFDVQWLDGSFEDTPSATVLGARLDVRF